MSDLAALRDMVEVALADTGNAIWATGYAGYSTVSLWQYAGSVGTYGFNADLTAFRGTVSDLRTLCLGTASGGDMNAIVTRKPLGSPTPRTFTVPAGTTLNGYSVTKPNQVVKSMTFPNASSAHASAEVAVAWTNADGTPATNPPTPRGAPFLEVVDGVFAGLLIVEAQVQVAAADPVYTAADLKAQYNAGVDAASTAAQSAHKA